MEATCIDPLSDKELDALIDDVIVRYADDPMHNPTETNRLNRMMGAVMEQVRGCREGKEIRERLKARWRVFSF